MYSLFKICEVPLHVHPLCTSLTVIAAVLGISAERVKKTHYRLRKRLDLSKEVDLEKFIQRY